MDDEYTIGIKFNIPEFDFSMEDLKKTLEGDFSDTFVARANSENGDPENDITNLCFVRCCNVKEGE